MEAGLAACEPGFALSREQPEPQQRRELKRSDLELEIERCGDELRIRPADRPITGALQALAAFSPSFLAEGREQDEQQDRESL